jgi:hypothetical protein
MAYISIASAAVGVYAQHESAKAQAEAIGNQAEGEREEAHAVAEEEMGESVRIAREKRARALTAAGESGALGQSFAVAMNQSIQDQDADLALAEKGLAFKSRGISDREGTALAGIRDPSALEAGLTIVGAGVSGYAAGEGIEQRRATKASGGGGGNR